MQMVCCGLILDCPPGHPLAGVDSALLYARYYKYIQASVSIQREYLMGTSNSYLMVERMIQRGEIMLSELERLLDALEEERLITAVEHETLLELAWKVTTGKSPPLASNV